MIPEPTMYSTVQSMVVATGEARLTGRNLSGTGTSETTSLESSQSPQMPAEWYRFFPLVAAYIKLVLSPNRAISPLASGVAVSTAPWCILQSGRCICSVTWCRRILILVRCRFLIPVHWPRIALLLTNRPYQSLVTCEWQARFGHHVGKEPLLLVTFALASVEFLPLDDWNSRKATARRTEHLFDQSSPLFAWLPTYRICGCSATTFTKHELDLAT